MIFGVGEVSLQDPLPKRIFTIAFLQIRHPGPVWTLLRGKGRAELAIGRYEFRTCVPSFFRTFPAGATRGPRGELSNSTGHLIYSSTTYPKLWCAIRREERTGSLIGKQMAPRPLSRAARLNWFLFRPC